MKLLVCLPNEDMITYGIQDINKKDPNTVPLTPEQLRISSVTAKRIVLLKKKSALLLEASIKNLRTYWEEELFTTLLPFTFASRKPHPTHTHLIVNTCFQP